VMSVEEFAKRVGIRAEHVRSLVVAGWPCARQYGGFKAEPVFGEHHVEAWTHQLELNSRAGELAALSPRYRTREIRVAWEQSPGPPEAGPAPAS
jgi:hypothetical protein